MSKDIQQNETMDIEYMVADGRSWVNIDQLAIYILRNAIGKSQDAQDRLNYVAKQILGLKEKKS